MAEQIKAQAAPDHWCSDLGAMLACSCVVRSGIGLAIYAGDFANSVDDDSETSFAPASFKSRRNCGDSNIIVPAQAHRRPIASVGQRTPRRFLPASLTAALQQVPAAGLSAAVESLLRLAIMF